MLLESCPPLVYFSLRKSEISSYTVVVIYKDYKGDSVQSYNTRWAAIAMAPWHLMAEGILLFTYGAALLSYSAVDLLNI